MEKHFIALDLSLDSTGGAVFTHDMKLEETFTLRIDDKAQETRHKLSYIGDSLSYYKMQYNPRFILIEAGYIRFIKPAMQLIKVFGIASYIFSSVPQYEVPAVSVKKKVTGNGRATKEDVAEAVEKYYPYWSFATKDETDACALGIYWAMEKGMMGKWQEKPLEK